MNIDWRVLFGIFVTVLWISVGVIYLIAVVGLVKFTLLPTGEIGSFLEGAFAPLAFLWLVIGHFMQQSEISANTQAVQSQEESAARQELHSRRNSFFKLLSLVQNQLGSIAGFHYISICGETGTGQMSSEEFANLRAESATSDSALFIRKMITLVSRQSDDVDEVSEILFGTEIRQRHSNNFKLTFKKILASAEAIDQDEMVVNAILYGSPAGVFYRIICHMQGEEDAQPLPGLFEISKDKIAQRLNK